MSNFKKIAMLGLTICLAASAFALSAKFAKAVDPWGKIEDPTSDYNEQSSANALAGETGLSAEKDPREVIVNIINVVLGFLGIVAVVIILIGGFKWMTAGGNEDQVGEAKKWIYSGVVGLLIILASYALANFVVNQLIKATTTTG
ncbi:hypothetical protein A2Y83_01820 [Candidatus Falkowbacteria bacterium RBG_13_39_14]|uniref:DUF4190 domain-containing protein n=1 Tax=Candidatus Falkowbacteria bacterium RBG_13_39_14 TaxID=1797985 RepID=A0A1F5S445_9BACT|nr:MAG: hypothetical protein A2Y83_01820 [Candidatus Falkowbacteria bacterium RBG_13_39_14]